MSLSRILNDDSVPPAIPPPPSTTTWSEQSPAPNPPAHVDGPFRKEPSPQESSVSGRVSPTQSLNDANVPTSEVEPPPPIPHPLPEQPPAPTPQRGKGRSKAAKASKGSVAQVSQPGEEVAAAPKKRRKANTVAVNANTEPKVPRTRRTSLRKQAAKAKANLALSPPGITPEPEIIIEQPLRPLTGEEVRLLSSDLEDCEEIWSGGIKEYEYETQKRRTQVVDWFENSEMEKNALTAQEMSLYYNTQISRIPLPPPPPPPVTHSISRHDLREHSPFPDYANGHEHGDRPPRRRQKEHRERYDSGAEDAAQELERSVLGDFDDIEEVRPPPAKKSKKAKESNKRPPSEAGSDREGPPPKGKPATKKRKLENGSAVKTSESHDGSPASVVTHLKGKARVVQREGSVDSISVSVSATPKGRKKGPKKKGALLGPDVDIDIPSGSHPPSIAGDATPAVLSRPGSPVPGTNGVIFELEENIPPLKKAKRMDDATMAKRVKSLEEAQKKVWTNIAKRDIAKVYKYQVSGYQARQSQLERIAKVVSLQARRPFTKTAKATKDTQAKAKRLMREMQVFWKKNEKEERDVRKREQKEASDRLKVEEEKREAARQARKLEFLISQTELYSHFVGNKLKTTEIEGDGENLPVPKGANVDDIDPGKLGDINFDDEDETTLHQHARHNAQEAIALAKQRAQAFDTQAALDRKTNEALALAKAQAHIHDADESAKGSNSSAPLVDLDSDELNFQNPTSLSGPLTIGQPKMLMAQLKEYQLKGLNWLATLYEQGINGILADEMGLGKTVQSISLLAYLAETHDIWGPFLVVAPASTLHNWQQEITRFVPGLKALPYWGNVKDRATLRKFWSKKEISYNRDAPFHVLITSYQLITQDQQYFQRVKWQYMILDEAQNIKNSASVRWKTLLGFQCRNRLLLTGTPIQNSMQELWALLHFIMPSLFDSHDEFNEWFSKDIENAAENKGSKLNEHQLRRLHMILKPFMLRRVKRHVQNELSEKIEIDVYVDLSARQRALYNVLLSRVSVADLLAKAANFNDAESARSLMNLVMQFRKVCNHPELFERADVIAPFSFSRYGRSHVSTKNEGDFLLLPYSSRNPIEFSIPKLFYLDGGLLDVPQEHSTNILSTSVVTKLFNIWSTDWIQQSLNESSATSFSFLRFIDCDPSEVHALHRAPLMRRRLLAVQSESIQKDIAGYCSDPAFAASATTTPFQLLPKVPFSCLDTASELPALHEVSTTVWAESCLSRPGMKWFVPPVVAPPISLYCAERTFLESQTQLLDAPVESLALYGLPPEVRDSPSASIGYNQIVPSISPSGLFSTSPQNQIPVAPMQVPEAKRLIYDSAKLARLDALLHELKQGDHRVLVYFQMTRMMDLMEEYLIYRQYKYLRLDGSSKLEDRRDMVIDWQTRPDIFVFLLSTRAGGLGINLTAADTVIFYDHDWNPSNDAQAMDRAHRLGQTRQVTVYRLITKGTIDERIIQLARVKKDVQDIVVGNKTFTDVAKPSEIVQLLLNDEQIANLNTGAAPAPSGDQKTASGVPQDLWNDDEDGFFGHSGQQSTAQDTEGNVTPVPTTSGRGRKRKTGATGAPRGRKPGKKKAGPVEETGPAAE